MKIHLAKYEPQRLGGGWTFTRNFAAVFGQASYEEADIYFIASPTMVQREDVERALADGKRIVLRIDNAVRNSRNRNTGMTRMKDFAEWADIVVYQSQWSHDYLAPFLKRTGPVIHNGVDLERYQSAEKNDDVLYSRFNRDETKNWEAARYWFSQHKSKYRQLLIVGPFSDELREGNFDFYAGEKFAYLGTLDERNMAKLYATTGNLLYTYFNDACSNTLIEALVSGCQIVGDEYFRTTGGAPEILDKFYTEGREYFGLDRMCDQYREAMSIL